MRMLCQRKPGTDAGCVISTHCLHGEGVGEFVLVHHHLTIPWLDHALHHLPSHRMQACVGENSVRYCGLQRMKWDTLTVTTGKSTYTMVQHTAA